MEGLLHYIWANRIFPATEMRTTDGRLLEVLDVGQHNRNQGSDFFNAKIRLNGTLWVGNVEIHEKSGDWKIPSTTTPYCMSLLLTMRRH